MTMKMYFIDLISSSQINEGVFLSFYENFNCIFTQFEIDSGYKIEVIFSTKDDLDDFLIFCNSSEVNTEAKVLANLVLRQKIKVFNMKEGNNWINYLNRIQVSRDLIIAPP